MRRPLGSNRNLIVLDQAVSSLTNFAAGVFAAKLLTVEQFGIYAIINFAFLIALGATRSALSDVATVNRAPTADGKSQVDLGASDGVAWIALVGLLICGAVATWTPIPPEGLLLAGVSIGCMIVQDATRMYAIAIEKAGRAVINDLIWLISLLAGIGGVLTADVAVDPYVATAVWGLTAVPAIVYGGLTNRWVPRLGRSRRFARSHRRLSAAFLGDWALKQGSNQAAVYGIGLLGSISAVANIRAGLLVLGPLNIAFTGLQLAATPAATRLRDADLIAMQRLLRNVSITLAAIALIAGVALTWLPEAALRLVVGEQAAGLSTYALPLAVNLMATGLMAGSTIGLRVLRVSGRLVSTRLATTVLFAAGGTAGWTLTGSVIWGLWGLAIGSLLGVALWEFSFKRALTATGRF